MSERDGNIVGGDPPPAPPLPGHPPPPPPTNASKAPKKKQKPVKHKPAAPEPRGDDGKPVDMGEIDRKLRFNGPL